MIIREEFLIGSHWVAPAGPDVLDVVSPITEQVFAQVPLSTNEDIDAAVTAARNAIEFGPWPRMSVKERGSYLIRMAELLRHRIDEAIDLQIDEMGSPYSFMSGITRGVLELVAPAIDTVTAIETKEVRNGSAGKILVSRDPIGVVASIIPWNGPFAQAFDAILTALLTGCPVVVKPSPESPLSAYLVAEAVVESGLPEGVVSIIPGGAQLGEYLVSHPGVDRVVFTGSSASGSRVAALCGERLRSATLELGGKSAAIVLPDADLDRDVPALIESSMSNNGQVCYATTRILAPRGRSEELVERLVAAVCAMKVGNPHEQDTDFGPLVSERQRDRVEGYIRSGRDQGARVALGGGRPAGLSIGWYIEPTIFTSVDNSIKIAQEEIFGPVVCVIDYDSEDEAIEIANDSDYGLGGAVFTADIDHGLNVARRIKTGTCRVNDAPPGGGGGPFGGTKRSGLGRKRDREGYEAFFEIQTIALPPGFVP